MKRLSFLLMLCLGLCLATGLAAAEPLGFGLVNTDHTNFRKKKGGDIAFRLDKEALVYIAQHQTDAKGREWYHVITYAHNQGGNEAWVLAEYVDAGDKLFSDITQVALSVDGMLALRSDGTVMGMSNGVYAGAELKKALPTWRDVRQVSSCNYSYYAVQNDGTLLCCGNQVFEEWGKVTDVRLLDACSANVVYVTQTDESNVDGEANYLGQPWKGEFDWPHVRQIAVGKRCLAALDDDGGARYFGDDEVPENVGRLESWTDLTAISAAGWERALGTPYDISRALFVGLHVNGTVSLTPAEAFPDAASWTDVVAVSVEDHYLLGLKRDGTAVLARDDLAPLMDVSHWRDVVAIDTAETYCVGVKRDGTLVWAGGYGL